MAIPAIILSALVPLIVDGIKEATKKSTVKIPGNDIKVITDEVVAKVGPVVANATNNEPAYKSRVTMGSVVAIMGALVGIYNLWNDGVYNSWEEYSPHVSVVLGAVYALYGRWIAKKPI